MKIAHVTAGLVRASAGVREVVLHQARAQSRLGQDVAVFGLQDPSWEQEQADWNGIKVTAARVAGPRAIGYAPAMAGQIAAFAPEIVHLHGLWLYPSIATLRWRLRTGGPTVISPHGMLDAWALRNSAWKKQIALALFERRNLNGAACLCALADSERVAIRAAGLRVPIAVIPNGVDLPTDDVPPSRPSLLDGDDRRVLLFLGRIHPKKGLSETIRAWAQVVGSEPSVARDWVLVIAGWDDGGHVEGLRRLTAELGVAGSVRFPGPVFGSDKSALLHAADAFILASHSEGLPMAVLEAWAHACPVLMTQSCNLPEGFAAGAAVEIPTEPSAMAPVLARCLADPDLAGLGLAGRKLAAEMFSWDRVGQDLAAVYAWLAGRAARPACVHADD